MTLYLSVLPSTFAQSSSVPNTGLPPGVIAVVNGIPISQAELEGAVSSAGQPDTLQLRQHLKELLIVREVLRQDAEKAGYGGAPGVQQAVAAAKANAEIQLLLRSAIRPRAVSEDDIRFRYDAISASLGETEYKASLISVRDAETAKVIIKKLKENTPFEALAKQYSMAPQGPSGGALPWISLNVPVQNGKTEGLPFPVAQALVKLSVNDSTTEPIHVGDAFVFVKLDAKRPTQPPPFEQVKESLRQKLQAEAMRDATDQFISGLVKQVTIRK